MKQAEYSISVEVPKLDFDPTFIAKINDDPHAPHPYSEWLASKNIQASLDLEYSLANIKEYSNALFYGLEQPKVFDRYLFKESDRDQAMLFKLTFGGQ